MKTNDVAFLTITACIIGLVLFRNTSKCACAIG